MSKQIPANTRVRLIDNSNDQIPVGAVGTVAEDQMNDSHSVYVRFDGHSPLLIAGHYSFIRNEKLEPIDLNSQILAQLTLNLDCMKFALKELHARDMIPHEDADLLQKRIDSTSHLIEQIQAAEKSRQMISRDYATTR